MVHPAAPILPEPNSTEPVNYSSILNRTAAIPNVTSSSKLNEYTSQLDTFLSNNHRHIKKNNKKTNLVRYRWTFPYWDQAVFPNHNHKNSHVKIICICDHQMKWYVDACIKAPQSY